MEDIITKIPLHEAREESDAFIDTQDVIEPTTQRPQHHGERADSMANDVCKMCGQKHKGEYCVPQAGEKERIAGNVESIATAIMEALDAVDADENTRISSIMIEIGLE